MTMMKKREEKQNPNEMINEQTIFGAHYPHSIQFQRGKNTSFLQLCSHPDQYRLLIWCERERYGNANNPKTSERVKTKTKISFSILDFEWLVDHVELLYQHSTNWTIATLNTDCFLRTQWIQCLNFWTYAKIKMARNLLLQWCFNILWFSRKKKNAQRQYVLPDFKIPPKCQRIRTETDPMALLVP